MWQHENMDGMTLDDLVEYENFLRLGAAYAKAKLQAMRLRASGHIDAAIRHEQECNRLYKNMPQDWRW